MGVQPSGAGPAIDRCREPIGKDRQLAGDPLDRCGHVRQLTSVEPSSCVDVWVDHVAQRADEGLRPRDDAPPIARLFSSSIVEDHAGAAGQLPRDPGYQQRSGVSPAAPVVMAA